MSIDRLHECFDLLEILLRYLLLSVIRCPLVVSGRLDPAAAPLVLEELPHVVRSIHEVSESEVLNEHVHDESRAANEKDCQPEQRRVVSDQHVVFQHRLRPPVRKPDVGDVHADGHHAVEEEAHSSPPLRLSYQLSCHHRVQTGEACQTQGPDVHVVTVWKKHIVVVENANRNEAHNKGVYNTDSVLYHIVSPGE